MTQLLTLDLPKHLKPLQQGALDNFCGVYAAINAIRIVDAFEVSSRRNMVPILFSSAVKYLDKRGKLPDVFKFGMGVKRQSSLTGHLLDVYRKQYGGELVRTLFTESLLDLEHYIEVELNAGRAVCICLEGALIHYTVICGLGAKRISLFDSQGMSWLERSSVAFNGTDDGRRFKIKPKSVFSIELKYHLDEC